jgi:hypothetical protein
MTRISIDGVYVGDIVESGGRLMMYWVRLSSLNTEEEKSARYRTTLVHTFDNVSRADVKE